MRLYKWLAIIAITTIIFGLFLKEKIRFEYRRQFNTGYLSENYKARLQELQSGDTIFIGDSHIERSSLQVNHGIGGDVTNGIIHRLDFVRGAKVCYILVGVNDIQRGVWLWRIRANYTEIINRIIDMGIKPIIVEVPPVAECYPSKLNGHIRRLNTFLHELGEKRGIDVIELSELWDGEYLSDSFTTDCIHLNEAGYGIMNGKLFGENVAAN